MEKWFIKNKKADFDLIVGGKVKEVSKEYIDYVKEFYPKLAEQGVIDKFFGIDTPTEKGGGKE